MKNFSIIAFWITFLGFLNNANAVANVSEWAEQASGFLNILGWLFSQEVLLNLIFAVITIILTFLLSKVIRDKLFTYLERKVSDNESWSEMVWVITRTVNVVVLIAGFSIVLWILWVDLTIFVWWIWFGIWFTLKTFLTNFIAWVIMVTQNTYHRWDSVEVSWEMWNIVKINTLFTSVRKFDGIMFYVPNINFIEEKVYNYSSNDKRRVDIELLIDYDSDIHKAKTIIYKVAENFPTVLKAPAVDVIVEKLDDSWILLKARFWMSSKDNYFHLKSNITETINLTFKQHWIQIAYPHLHISTWAWKDIAKEINLNNISS